MTRWFAALPIHRKLVTMALAVSTAALVAAIVGLVVFDVARFRQTAADDAQALAQVIAENAAAAIVFDDENAARQMLGSMQVRPVVSRACVYRADGTVLAGYERTPVGGCPATPARQNTWRAVASVVPVSRNGRVVGAVYVERLLSDLRNRVLVTAAAGLLTLLVAAALAFGLASRMQEIISRPIVALAHAARGIGRDEGFTMPPIDAPPDETGALVQAFSDMVQRLVSSNQALTMEVEQRRRMQLEREQLLAREREASRLKDEFLAAVSHELRTPLNAILGWTQVLASTKLTEQTLAKALASLSRNAQAQNRVIEDLLDVSRIITGKLQLTPVAVDLRGVVDAAVEVVSPIAAAKNIHIDATVPPIACVVQGDFDRLRQIIWNLLSNAIKFTPAGGAIHVDIREPDGGYAVVVADTGIGITPEFLPHVFERFRQADGSTTRQHGGLGLGLAIVKELVELHGGRVTAESPGPGRGATFTAMFPRLVDVGGGTNAIVSAAEGKPRLEGIDVLAVDDNGDALDIVASALGAAGARVRIATSAAAALEEIRRSRPDIVLCDLAMPGIDGFELLKRMHASDDAQMRVIPVLAVTAYASEEYRQRCLAAGFQAHLSKPFNTEELVRTVAAAVV